MGLGTEGGPVDLNSCGNEALFWNDNRDKHIKAIGHMLTATLSCNLYVLYVMLVVSLYLIKVQWCLSSEGIRNLKHKCSFFFLFLKPLVRLNHREHRSTIED